MMPPEQRSLNPYRFTSAARTAQVTFTTQYSSPPVSYSVAWCPSTGLCVPLAPAVLAVMNAQTGTTRTVSFSIPESPSTFFFARVTTVSTNLTANGRIFYSPAFLLTTSPSVEWLQTCAGNKPLLQKGLKKRVDLFLKAKSINNFE